MHAAGALVPFAAARGLTISSPFALNGTEKVAPGAAPDLGEHSEAVLREAGFSDAEIDGLRERGVIRG
jgi:formyl-CoA transferase